MHAHLHIESILPHSQVWIDREMHGQCAACRCGVVSVVSLLEVSSCLVLSRLQSSAWPRRHDLLQVLCCWPPSYLYPCFVLYTVWLRRSACCLVPVDASGGTQVLTVGNKLINRQSDNTKLKHTGFVSLQFSEYSMLEIGRAHWLPSQEIVPAFRHIFATIQPLGAEETKNAWRDKSTVPPEFCTNNGLNCRSNFIAVPFALSTRAESSKQASPGAHT